jgi:hypothetical protein
MILHIQEQYQEVINLRKYFLYNNYFLQFDLMGLYINLYLGSSPHIFLCMTLHHVHFISLEF